jgi:hypothetical protein
MKRLSGYANRFSILHPDGLPIESVLDAIDPKSSREAMDAYGCLIMCLFRCLNSDDAEPPWALRAWLKKVRDEGDVILTTNYDITLEYALAYTESGYTYGPGDIDRGALQWIDFGVRRSACVPLEGIDSWASAGHFTLPILKLHGSLSWSECLDCGCYLLDPLHEEGGVDALAGAPCRNCESRRTIPVVVPPSRSKRYSDPAIAEVWRRAELELGSVQELVFAGFSLNRFDPGVRQLIRAACLGPCISRVKVIDPAAQSLVPRYREVCSVSVEAISENWRDVLERNSEQISSVG